MVTMPLPALITLDQHRGDWPNYLEAIYQYYINEVVKGRLFHKNLPIKCQFRPAHANKGFGFWHTISTGTNEEDRIPDLRRCERIRWIAWVINNVKEGLEHIVTYWENKRGANTHVVLFFEQESYAVVLAKRSDYYLLKTAYCADERRKKRLIQERKEYWDTKRLKAPTKTPSDTPSTHGR